MTPEHYTEATDFETRLFGSAILAPYQIPELAEIVSGQCFHDPDVGNAFQLFIDLHEAGKPVSDCAVLVSELKRSGMLATLGIDFVTRCVNSICDPKHAVTYARKVRELWHYRQLERIGTKLAADATNQADPPESIRLRFESQLEQIVEPDAESDVVTLYELVGDAIREVREAKQRGVTLGLPTGFSDVDELTGGFFRGDLTILAARPSIGKSALALDLAAKVAERGKQVLLVSLEMSGKQIAHRFLSRETGIPVKALQQADLNSHQDVQLIEAKERLRSLPLKSFVSSSATVQQIRARAKVQLSQGGLDLLIIDYLGLIGSNSRLSIYERITALSRELKQLAMAIDRPVLCLAQLNRAAAKCELPTLEHLRDSGAIEQDADNVWLLHRDDRAASEAKLIVAKQRQGCIGTIGLAFNGERMSFTDGASGEAWEA